MTETWRDKRQTASFRGVPFFVDGDSTPVGRRTQLHEYPQRDKPQVEDMGAKTREVKLTGFVIGDDCLFQRDNLLNALDKPGSGELVHPWFGRMTVTAGDGCEVSHERREGGMVRFELVFIEAGEKGYPKGVKSEASQAEEDSEGFLESAIARYKAAMALVNRARMAVTVLQNGIAGIQMAIQQELAQVLGLVSSIEALADMLINAPGNFAAMIRAQFASVGGRSRSSGYRWAPSGSTAEGDASVSVVEADPEFARTVAALDGTEPVFTSFVAASRDMTRKIELVKSLIAEIKRDSEAPTAAGGQETAAVVKAARELMRDALVVQIVRVAVSMPVVSAPAVLPGVPVVSQQVGAPITRPDVPVTSDVIALREAVSDVLWSIALVSPHDHFEALEAVRKRVKAHLSEVAAAGVRLVAIDTKESLPALVLAYQCFGDATRAAEIVTRNRVSHPGFLPAGSLYVAQE
ncbi:DNA circularization N-terminal domain-containing protein [Pseudomonas proteolytica]|uniref:DNA circularization N-terminal domain-containing protein n=1 Tax=Pseudomonas proteolytica TaxID=219574 RepID=UPI0014735431|nr:hydroxyacid dehydrogenase [Pseudomonas proteolytica]